jgi:hypothetical protein
MKKDAGLSLQRARGVPRNGKWDTQSVRHKTEQQPRPSCRVQLGGEIRVEILQAFSSDAFTMTGEEWLSYTPRYSEALP